MGTEAFEVASAFIKKFEGLNLKVYKCSAGVRTIGYGHAVKASDNLGDVITAEKAQELLKQDILRACGCLRRNLKGVFLSFNQVAALVSFIFNLGSGCFQSSALRQKLLRGEYELAAQELKRFVYVGGKKIKGLVSRREAEQRLFKTI
ncbi:MAG: lysozyme [Candidatus Omnitrophica bacterium]|nr:lysozyme [Candidatus Omnitrophota bacterium]